VPLKRSTNGFLLRAPALDEGGLDALLAKPGLQRRGDELAPVVGAEHLRLAVRLEEALELGDDVARPDRAGDPDTEGEACVLVGDVQDADLAARRVRVARKSYDQTSLGAPAARFQRASSALPCARLPEAWLRLGGTRWPSARQRRRSACG
jgi:hypothetical protein